MKMIGTVLDPDGGQHICRELSGGLLWCAGLIGRTAAELADRIHADWNDPNPYDSTYKRQESGFADGFNE